MYRHVINSSILHLLYCKWSLELQVHNVYTRIQFNLYLYKDPNQGSYLYKDHINLYIYQDQMPYQNFKSIVLYHFLPLTTRNFGVIWSYDQCHRDIFIFRNLMTHIVCHHYVHMTHVKFLEETDQMINTGHDFIFLDKYQLGFTLSYVRVLGFRTLHIYQNLSYIWDITMLRWSFS